MTSTVYIAKSVYGGDGLGRLGDGRVVFVPGAMAGENVRAEIFEEHKHFVKAHLVEVVEASADRIEPGRTVPGMVYANFRYDAELRAKEEQLADFFSRARIRIPSIKGLNEGLPETNYRNKVVYHFEKEKVKSKGEKGRSGSDEGIRIGYKEEPSNRIVDVMDDPLAHKAINAELPAVRRMITSLLTTGPMQVRQETERKGKVTIRYSERSGVKWWIGDPTPGMVLKEVTDGKVFEVPGDGFYQVNPIAGERLVQAVKSAYEADKGATPRMLDLYCGVGVFGLCCNSEQLIGVESGRQAIEFAKRNAAAQGRANAKFFAEQVGQNLRRIPVGRQTCVVVDPPRGGLEPRVPEWIARSGAPKVLYVSCDPATLMRDLRVITSAYEVANVSWINMFPRTARFETIVELRRK